jgi:hypothetical protein
MISFELDVYCGDEAAAGSKSPPNKGFLHKVKGGRMVMSSFFATLTTTSWALLAITIALAVVALVPLQTAQNEAATFADILQNQSGSMHGNDESSKRNKSITAAGTTSPSPSLTMVYQVPSEAGSSSTMVPLEYILEVNSRVVINYYAHWSTASQSIRSLWKEAVQSRKEASYVALVELDCEVYQEKCQKDNITSVPAIRYYRGTYDNTTAEFYDERDNVQFTTDRNILEDLNHYLSDRFCDDSDDPEWYSDQDNNPEAFIPYVADDDALTVGAPTTTTHEEAQVDSLTRNDIEDSILKKSTFLSISTDSDHLDDMLAKNTNEYCLLPFSRVSEMPRCPSSLGSARLSGVS